MNHNIRLILFCEIGEGVGLKQKLNAYFFLPLIKISWAFPQKSV